MTYLFIEILGFIIIILFYIIVLIFLHQTNIAIFRNIINMFINTKKGNFQYTNKKDNYLLIKIISGFMVLIHDFNLDNLRKFQCIIEQPSSHRLSLDSTIDIKDDLSVNSFDLYEDEKIKIQENNYTNNINKNKNDIINKMVDSKMNNSEIMKLNLSSSKTSLKNIAFGDTLKNLNSPQKSVEFNTPPTNISNLSSNKSTINSNKTLNTTLTNKNFIKHNKSLYQNKLVTKTPKKKYSIQNNQDKIKQKKTMKIEDNINDEEKMTADIFLKKLVNNGLKEIKISLIMFC